MWAKKAREEHDAFAQALRDKGVDVHYYGQLLAETLEIGEGHTLVLDRVCTPENLGPSLVGPCSSLFEDLPGRQLADYLVGGVLKADLHPSGAHSLKWDMLHSDDFVSRPSRTTCSSGITPLDLQRSDHQPDGQAGSPAGNPAHEGDLQVPPAVRRQVHRSTTAMTTRHTSRPRLREVTSMSLAIGPS